MTHIWSFQGINDRSMYNYRCAHCGLEAVLEVYGDLADLGAGIICQRDPIQLELL